MRMTRSICIAIAILAAERGALFGQGERSKALPFTPMENEAARKLLVRDKQTLPVWARILAKPLPKTTGLMLELDYLHRAKNPLGPIVAGKLRWVAADAIDCGLAKRAAEADLLRAGFKEFRSFADGSQKFSKADTDLAVFARKMTLQASTITDEEVAGLVEQMGAEAVVGAVHTVAYANFQNRLFLALGIDAHAEEPLPPTPPPFGPEESVQVVTPKRLTWAELPKVVGADLISRPEWSKWTGAALEEAVDRQKDRKARVPVPDASRFANLPPEAKSKIEWTHISTGYQPALTKAWFDCMRMFQQEAQLDRVFTNSMFWVITRNNECFY